MTEAGLAEYCRKLGHDTEQVVTIAGLGVGSDDADIIAHAEHERRLLVTYDDNFLVGHDALSRVGILFQPNNRTPPFETATIIDTIADHTDQETIREHDEPFHLTTDWL